MSQWTHINAVIRFDCIRVLGMTLPDLDGVPSGSEGDMQIQIWQNPSANSLASHTVMFWGDLRDYSDHDEVLAYFQRITSGIPIRSGLLEIDVEGSYPSVYRYQGNKFEQITLITNSLPTQKQ